MVAGDFNAKSPEWCETHRDAKGETLAEWAGESMASILNRGHVSTCVRPQGESIVNVTMASPSAERTVSGAWSSMTETRPYPTTDI